MQCRTLGGLPARSGARLEIPGQVGQGLAAVAFGGRGDGPDPGGQVRGPLGLAPVVVLPPDDRGPQRPLSSIVIQLDVGEVPVAGQTVPFPVEGRQDLLRGGMQTVDRGLLTADGVHDGQGLVERLGCLGVSGAADRGGGELPVGDVQVRDPRHPLVPPDA